MLSVGRILRRVRVHAVGAMCALFVAALPVSRAVAQQTPQQPHALVAVSKDSVDLGDSFILQVTVDGSTSAQEPTLPASDAYKAEFLGGRDESSRSVFTINGRRSESNTMRYVMQWRITPLKAGRSAVEAFSVKVGTQSLSVPRTEFSASEPGANPNFQLVLEPVKTDVYVGEPVRMRLVWTLGRNVKSASFSGPDGGQEFDVVPMDPRPPGSRGNPQNNDPYRIVPFLDSQIVISRSQVTRDEQTLLAFTAELVITPRRTGKLEVGPYRVAFDEVVGQKQRSFFDSPFDDLSQTRRSVVASEAVMLDVKALPTEGRPADFSGLIGTYSLEAAAGNSEANVGDPIALTLTIRGPEPLNSLKAPALESQPEMASKFKPAPEGWESADSAVAGQRVFTTTIRPKSDSVTEVPAIRLPYFDVKTGMYDVALSKRIPLKVHAVKEVTLADALRPGGGGLQLPAATAPVKLTDANVGIGANTESLSALRDQRVSLLAVVRSPGGVAFLVAPPAALAFAAVLAHRRRVRDPLIAARRAAVAEARRRVGGAGTVAEVAVALRRGLSPYVGLGPESVTSRDVAGHFGPEMSRRIAELLGDLESAEFDSRPLELEGARKRSLDIVMELRKV